MSATQRNCTPVVVLLYALIASCGGSHEGGSDSGAAMDAGGYDAGDRDAGTDVTDAGTAPEACTSPGDMRATECGRCGLVSQLCGEDRLWEDTGMCLGEGPCAPGAVETEDTPRCGRRSRICTNECAWLDWTVLDEDRGECERGETRPAEGDCTPGLFRQETCTEECAWGPPSCDDPCGGTIRLTPEDAQEVCVPAGLFVRGDETAPNAQPVADVHVSAYYVDRFPVTNRRYGECVSAGACTAPRETAGQTSLADPERRRFAVQGVSFEQAGEYCAWDEGRRLLTEAEWEKAARGPAPRAQRYTWEGARFWCSALYTSSCGWRPVDRVSIPQEYDGIPLTRSYYGAEGLIGTGFEWVSDTYRSDYYEDPDSLVDPTGPGPPTGSFRGAPRVWGGDLHFRVSRRWPHSASGSLAPLTTIRCARSARAE